MSIAVRKPPLMSEPVAKLSGKCGVRWWCPGCEHMHIVPVKPLIAPATGRPGAPDGWDFNGDYERPTLSPSVLVYGHQTLINEDLPYGDGPGQLLAPENKSVTPRCHTFIRDGRIEFLSDCEHALAGQTVVMGPVDQ